MNWGSLKLKERETLDEILSVRVCDKVKLSHDAI